MAAFVDSYTSIIPKLLDQAIITYNGNEYTHVPAERTDLTGTAGTYTKDGEEIFFNEKYIRYCALYGGLRGHAPVMYTFHGPGRAR